MSPTEGQEPGHDSVITGKTFPLTALKENLGLKSLRSLTAEMKLRTNHLLNWIPFQTYACMDYMESF